ncbi:hypothetical protein F0562_019785 [Nyssa sinensis]|uniref:Uncharacterized protein n=1 Tax=Nyssa sinensis TaxID=561372 RepID=A0A5J5BQ68_9ASTE|nr:hypothetical protein F0562_019785 [Nyssa sinensis]
MYSQVIRHRSKFERNTNCDLSWLLDVTFEGLGEGFCCSGHKLEISIRFRVFEIWLDARSFLKLLFLYFHFIQGTDLKYTVWEVVHRILY